MAYNIRDYAEVLI